uniref:Uncharacterized protein n=1 Tax=Caenorhabditis japonica TaxID=281687 RepID=A0A8R1HI72_CAEJA
MRLPIIRPKLPGKPASGSAVRLITSPPPLEPSSSNPRPLISLLDRTEFRNRNRLIPPPTAPKPKKQYFTEINEIRKEFGIPETFETSKPNTMSGVGGFLGFTGENKRQILENSADPWRKQARSTELVTL